MPAFRVAAVAALSFLSLGASPAIEQAPVRVIYLQSYAYAPSPIRLQAGRPVTLQFVNRAGKGHDFTARNFFRSARILAGRVSDGEIDLGARQSARVTLIPAAGRYPVHCGRPFHKALGMRSVILVQ
jgi:plastocyanin